MVLMNESVKGALLGTAFGGVIWLATGMWQFCAVAALGAVCTWLFTPPVDPQPLRRSRVRVKIRDMDKVRSSYFFGPACYDYGGCQWAGDGCTGKPVVLGPGTGCYHMRMQASLGISEGPSSGKRCLDDGGPLCSRACDGSVRCPCMGD